MHRSIIKLLLKCDTGFSAFESKCFSWIGKIRISKNLHNHYYSYLINPNNLLIHSLKLPNVSGLASVVENQRAFSQKVEVEENCDSPKHGETILKGKNSTKESDEPCELKIEEDTDLFNSVNYEEITGGDSELLNELKLMVLEVDVLRQDGFRVPKQLTTDNWKELLALKSRSQKRKFLEFLWLNEIRKINDKKRKEVRKKETEVKLAELAKERENNDHITYGFRGNTIFLRVYDTTINLFDNSKLIQAMMHGLNFVIDCGYDKNMSNVENKLCAKQLCFLFAENRLNKDPFNIHFCNTNRNSIWFKQLKKFIPTIDDPEFPINISEDHYTTLFPKEKLVYLTPHCRTELTTFNPDDIYIVGALVDRQNNEPLSMAKAKSEGIRMAKLPLDRYLDWEMGTKSLTVNQMMKIMLEVRTSGDWNLALQHVPKRKLREPGQPKQDLRRYAKNRGTAFQPPPNYRTTRKLW